MINLLKISDYKETLWKNGKGKTFEIDIFPPLSEMSRNNFTWRLSSAKVTESSPFSQFLNYERKLVIWTGEGLKLNQKNLLPYEPISFSGSENITCEIIGKEEVVDLGIIYDSSKVLVELEVRKLNPGEILKIGNGVEFLFLASNKKATINGISLIPGESIKIENEDSIQHSPKDQEVATFFHITILPKF